MLFVCEDNQTGISVPTPEGWIEATFANQPHLHYRRAGGELDEIWDTVAEAIHLVRAAREPLFLHLDVVRLWGHAGSDAEQVYRPPTRSRPSSGRTRSSATRAAWRRPEPPTDQLHPRRRRPRTRVGCRRGGDHRPRLSTTRGHRSAGPTPDRWRLGSRAGARRRSTGDPFFGTLPETATQPTARTLAGHINAALTDELARRPELLVFGEDVGAQGRRVQRDPRPPEAVRGGTRLRHPARRDLDPRHRTGRGPRRPAPHPEIQYLAYIHNALDQIRGEAATLQFFSSGQFRNPMVVRSLGLAYQKGFGGHFHNDNSVGALRDIPGVILAVPSRPKTPPACSAVASGWRSRTGGS